MNKTIFIEKRKEFNSENCKLYREFKNFLSIGNLQSVRVINAFNISNFTKEEYEDLENKLFKNENTDIFYENKIQLEDDEKAFRVQGKDGQYNQREDMTNEYIKKFFSYDNINIKHSKVIILKGIDNSDLEKIKKYYINNVDSKEIPLDDSSVFIFEDCEDKIEKVDNFINMNERELENLISNFAMDLDDIKFVQNYFREENRNPNIWELKTIDTYWSDHCRHTTFFDGN
ncbi:hypothetical protein [Miniphocaeibacter halophilus]|uniref:Uncharacterized protein n=1 Tax=Miniphocaeibacter halophilus TaxID=2931922 RepID=A0AC61MUZ2_9FIRM|nr:hypothetical protein [Miniphocaeibacter halophilus]QQK07996.1 hypothetical protein JFY71_00210 [Miniphocaeibacter halophilus]